ncbi:SGNH/GDSL hydrolase family protein [Cellvibrio sp. pealriver]|uniref:SGNH/GDSL hydrolase family protein n=1 Tax=Cellvibrio sp. pealriver TaxID=1622269 RepID=UPI00066FD802|nr:SGNH/GDSL hydrolase family protein [Cellvibrio sp. pealriver]
MKIFALIPALALCLVSASCSHPQNASHKNIPSLNGVVIEKQPLANAHIILRDSTGKMLTTTTDNTGQYQLSLQGITLPITLSAVSNGSEHACLDNTKLRPVCMAAVINTFPNKNAPIGNINPLTDRITSDIAASQGFIGPQQWIMQNRVFNIDEAHLEQARAEMRSGFLQALKDSGVTHPESFDPATYPIKPHDNLSHIFSYIHHNRNYDNNTGEPGHTTLSDISFRPIVGLTARGAYEPLDLARARIELNEIQKASVRIFIVGDSTSAVYEQLRYPRMGWGQQFANQLHADKNIKVIVGSRAGRSSRDFYNGRWFAQMENLIQQGDYVFINHGHNDQNCDVKKPLRGIADVTNLCTYPNSPEGKPQYPAGSPELSFQHSLERYIHIARKLGAQPVLFTPTARIKDKDGKQATLVISSHFTRQNINQGYLFTGNYTQTIKDTARANKVPLIDLEAASIEFANKVGTPGWKNYWLVVDPSINAFYANGVPGSPQSPDGTHFQENGASVIASLVAREIKRTPELSALKRYFKQ